MSAANEQVLSDFEKSLEQLEQIVSRMEQGELTLEESLSAFEEGVKLTRTCQNTLKQAEQRVSKLINDQDGFKEEPFDDSEPV